MPQTGPSSLAEKLATASGIWHRAGSAAAQHREVLSDRLTSSLKELVLGQCVTEHIPNPAPAHSRFLKTEINSAGKATRGITGITGT